MSSYSDKPTELILFKGNPEYNKIEGANLMWAKNTESWVFQDSSDNQFYFLVSGRWFRAPKLDGPWSYAGNDLPADLKNIPLDFEAADVLASVPGTDEAEGAVLLAQVPTEAVVKRSEAEQKVKVAYQGDPQFQPIEGTSMSYASNTSSDIIKVENKYYLCQDAVWFVSDSATGPWKVTTNVPDAIYTIPSSSPAYRVTYVKVVESDDPDEVVCSYTANDSNLKVRNENPSDRGKGIENRPASGAAPNRPSSDVMSGLDRQAHTRERGDLRANRTQTFERSGIAADFGGSRSFSRAPRGGFRRR